MKKSSTKNTIKYADLLIHISGEYLTDHYPKNFATMKDEEIDAFIQDHVYEPFENESVEDVKLLIENGAYALREFLKSKGIKVSK